MVQTSEYGCSFLAGAYDALLCSAGMFAGSIVPQAPKEFIRIACEAEYVFYARGVFLRFVIVSHTLMLQAV